MNETTEVQTEFSGAATYCPEDNKLRLYIGRVPREEYLALKAEGWTALHKQREAGKGDFVATWTPARRDTALRYAGMIEDEDAGPEERAVDRAERFGGYLEKRLDEAGTHADRYDSGPQVHGFQSYARAVKAADRHDRMAGKAVDAWEKAEYWQRRTAGVINHALYVSSPAVRMGRIKEIEADIRRCEKSRSDYENTRNLWLKCQAMPEGESREAFAKQLAYVEHGDYTHPRTGKKSYLYDLAELREGRNDDPLNASDLCALYLSRHGELAPEGDWLTHYRLRLAYENQMLEAQGGRAAFVEMEVGGWLGKHQIRKVNKSPATGRVVSVTLRMQGNRWGNEAKPGEWYERPFNIERLPSDAYRAPTEEERAEFATKKKAEKVAAKASKVPCPLVNPSDEDAERLQEIWNDRYARQPEHRQKVLRMTQAEYSARSGGMHAQCKTVIVCETGCEHRTRYGSTITRHNVFKVRQTYGQGNFTSLPDRVIVLTDAPQKPVPWDAIKKARALCPSEKSMWDKLPKIAAGVRGGPSARETDEMKQILRDAEYVGWISKDSWSQVPFTEKGIKALKEWEEEQKLEPVTA